MSDPDTFSYTSVEVDSAASTVTCRYRLGREPFVEVAALPGADLSAPGVAEAAELYFLLAGVSYYKTRAPSRIDLGPLVTTEAERSFLRTFYLAGLGEFALKNGLDLTGVVLEGPEAPRRSAVGSFDPGAVLIPFGGGLDSIVTVAELAPLADRAALFVAERPGARFAAIEAPAAVTGLDVVRAERSLDPKVLSSGAHGYLNGHVPVTGVLSALGVLAAVGHGFGSLAMSNERSASSATTETPGGPVNHQWSKGAAFEEGFRSLVADRLAGFCYFSWLRDRSEGSIAERFAALPEYHRVFRSCNRSFHQDPAARLESWCGACDKCLFIDLVLAPHLAPDELAAIFDGTEPIESEELADQLAVLVGAGDGPRPFECVGDEAECREALLATAARADRANSTIIQRLAALSTEPDEAPIPHVACIPERYAPRHRLG
jgi:hypothetical protein